MQRIFLIGPPGSGKTSVGLALAKILDCDFFDTDRLIEYREGKSVSEIFAEQGEAHFRTLESRLLSELEAIPVKPAPAVVFATGGGLPVYNNNIDKLQTLGKVIALNADVAVLTERLLGDRQRPLLAGSGGEDTAQHLQSRLSELIDTRWPVYERAGYKINTSGFSAEEVANEIIRLLGCNT